MEIFLTGDHAGDTFVWALGQARVMVADNKLVSDDAMFERIIGSLTGEVSGVDVDAVALACRQAAWEALRAVYGDNSVADRACWDEGDRLRARQWCNQLADAYLAAYPSVGVNELICHMKSIFPQRDMNVGVVVRLRLDGMVFKHARS